ncbi:MAG: hypothetical protein M3Z21_04175 [Pseudomonadota bacterium]|nr:hypothetical protein [Pseudomonadota bacterium]
MTDSPPVPAPFHWSMTRRMPCEACGRGTALAEGWFSVDGKGNWAFLCTACPRRCYDVETCRVFASPGATIAWLVRFHKMPWFDPGRFLACLGRLQQAGKFDIPGV